ncbi:MAG: hypothetical protein JWQ35_1517 [Bacteriovoracaceae bacterium]|nr:hypothetical protein [Bacteriovoracaceae bacterium]
MGDLNKKSTVRGFTLLEMMITVLIVIIVSVIGVNSLQSSIQSADVVAAAQTLASDLAKARGEAALRGCPTRIIMCGDRVCATAVSAPPVLQSSSSGSFLGAAANKPAQFIGILLQTTPCTIDAGNASDGYANWDFDPKLALDSIPTDVVFTPIYSGPNSAISNLNADGAVGSSLVVGNSLWFSSSLNPSTGTIPVSSYPHTASGNTIVFQVRMASCDPGASDSCLGYFVTISPGGVTNAQKCFTPRRSADGQDNCY